MGVTWELINRDYIKIGTGVLAHAFLDSESLLPHGAKVMFVSGDESASCKEVYSVMNRFYRAQVVKASASVEIVKSIRKDEDVGGVVATGGEREIECAKYLAQKFSLPLIVFPTSCESVRYLAPSAVLDGEGGIPEGYKTKSPDLVIVEESLLSREETTIAAGYGDVCARLCSHFDAVFSFIVGEADECDCESAVVSVVKELVKRETAGALSASDVIRFALAIGVIMRESGSSRLVYGGDFQLCSALRLKKKNEGKTVKKRGENALMLSAVALRVYEAAIADGKNVMQVADNRKRLSLMGTALGVGPFAAIKHIGVHPSLCDVMRLEHCINEYRSELMQRAVIYEKTLRFAQKRLKRLYKDKGFSYNNYISETDLRVCLALASEMSSHLTVLGAIKRFGLSDLLIRRKNGE